MKPIQDNKLLEEGVLMDTYTLLEIATSKLLENTRFIPVGGIKSMHA